MADIAAAAAGLKKVQNNPSAGYPTPNLPKQAFGMGDIASAAAAVALRRKQGVASPVGTKGAAPATLPKPKMMAARPTSPAGDRSGVLSNRASFFRQNEVD